MDTSTPPNVGAVEAALAQAKGLEAQLVEFLTKIEAASGRKPWAILASPAFLHGIVTALAFKYACREILRADTRVSEDDVKAYLEHFPAKGPGFMSIRKPAMQAVLFGVPFIGAEGIPDGALCFIPAKPLEIHDGSEATSVGEAGPA